MLEIGAGYGSLTKQIVKTNPKKVYAIEKDEKLFFSLKNTFKNLKNVEIINDDIFNIIKNRFIITHNQILITTFHSIININ